MNVECVACFVAQATKDLSYHSQILSVAQNDGADVLTTPHRPSSAARNPMNMSMSSISSESSGEGMGIQVLTH